MGRLEVARMVDLERESRLDRTKIAGAMKSLVDSGKAEILRPVTAEDEPRAENTAELEWYRLRQACDHDYLWEQNAYRRW